MQYKVRDRFHDELLQDLLLARGVESLEAQEQFLRPDFERDSHDPFQLPDMGLAVERLLYARQKGELVCVWSDYDCDGIPGGVMLTEFLRSVGFTVRHYIPHRHKEGYGLNNEGLQRIKDEGASLVITVDLGITDTPPIMFANSIGLQVIVTDHHLPLQADSSDVLPPALAVVNPKREDNVYPFDGLCGAGVAWKLAQAILISLRNGTEPFDYAEGKEKWLLDLVGLATVADRMPLLGENRMLAHYGLVVMRRARRPGLRAMLAQMRTSSLTLTEDDIGFMIAPRINAASRMDEPETAAKLLATQDLEEARNLARELDALNTKRKTIVGTTVKEVNKRLLESGNTLPVIVMGSPNWRPGILGLVANSLMEAHGKPVFLWGREASETLRGSCRSDGTLNVVELMQTAGDVFEDFGGHFAAGGFSVPPSRIHELSARLCAGYEALRATATLPPPTIIERELPLGEVSHAHTVLKRLAPFGEANQKPLFMFPRVEISRAKVFGKTKNHLDLQFRSEEDYVGGTAFFSGLDSFTKTLVEGERADIAGYIENDWKGGTRIRVVDVL